MNEPVDDSDEELQALEQRERHLIALVYERHSCEPNLVVRRRTFAGGASHFVYQCLVCGEQRQGPLAKRVADDLLKGKACEPFDEGAHARYRQQDEANTAERVRVSMRIAELRDPERARLDAQAQLAYEAQAQRLRDGLTQAVDAVMTMDVRHRERHLLGELFKLRPKYSPQPVHSPQGQRFGSEEELRAWLDGWIENDFDVWREVPGIHLAERVRVRVDYVMRPKPHLIAAGFMPCYFGVEAKHLPTDHGFSPRASKAVRQAMSYMDSAFELDGAQIRLHRLLLFSNVSFEAERRTLKGIEQYALSNEQAKWVAFLELANHANVGNLEIYGDREGWKGWRIAFATGKYFSRFLSEYELGDANLFAKVRVGNFGVTLFSMPIVAP